MDLIFGLQTCNLLNLLRYLGTVTTWHVSICSLMCLQDINKLLTDLSQILWNDRPSAKDQSIRF